MKKFYLFAIVALLGTFASFSQVTTASVKGAVTDEQGEALPGASIVAVHIPSGTKYGTVTQFNGSFNIPNMRIGGPYSITVSFVGFKTEKDENIHLQIGQKLKLNYVLKEESSQLAEVVVNATSRNSVINSGRTGSSTSINATQIKKLPTISRSINDFTRLAPSSDGNSFSGGNNKMNNLTLDGSIFNNPFGLDGGTPGSQTNAQPISLDAIDQIQVDIAPYDVSSSGFTGASINAVTKSGTNEFHGSVFGFFRNQDLTGSKVGGVNLFKSKLNHTQAGFSVGGPIIKDKLFFFANAEIERRDDLVSGFRANNGGETVGNGVSRVLKSDLDAVSAALDALGYKTGGYENLLHATDNEKFIVKLDWNINENHSLTATYNSLNARRDKPAHPNAFFFRGPNQNTLQFENSSYTINNKIQSALVELKSRFGNKYSNNLQVGYTHFDDFRSPFSAPAPSITILKDGSPYIIAGHEPFSIHNKLDQKVFQATNNFKIYAGSHTVTLGFAFEKFSFDNSFNLGTYGARGVFFPTAGSVADFLALAADPTQLAADFAAAQAAYDNNNANNTWALAETNVGQLAFYFQDEWTVNEDFTFTYGVRFDKPEYFDTQTKIQENIDRSCCYDPSIQYFDENGNATFYDSTKLPSSNWLVSPRIGFNWDITGDNTQQLRGGMGIFSGRLPFVWIGNQVQNVNSFFYTVVDPKFNFPQVLRASLGYDHKFDNGLTTIFDVMYSRNIDAIFATNIGLGTPSGSLDGVGSRPIYLAGDVTNNAWSITNTNVGSVFNFSAQIKKRFENGLDFSLAYDYLNAQDATSPTQEITNATFNSNPAFGNVNKAVANPSRFGHKNRFVGSATKTYHYGAGEKWATSFSTFFEYTETGRFSYVYGGDINGDGSASNDLIYIPTTGEIASMAFTGTSTQQTAQRAALDAYIKQDAYLSSRRGTFSGRNANLTPWFSDWDIRITQDYNINDNGQKLQFSIDILNFGNLLNSNWGVRQIPVNTQPIGVSVDGSGVPTYTFDTTQVSTFTNDLDLRSRWQMQFGLRYIF
ncbi:MAG: TonB-dependent receptor [Flavobacteriaceae bacterium]|nr:TonB-dependent receptor [Flavobacteriaceae bacterium]